MAGPGLHTQTIVLYVTWTRYRTFPLAFPSNSTYTNDHTSTLRSNVGHARGDHFLPLARQFPAESFEETQLCSWVETRLGL